MAWKKTGEGSWATYEQTSSGCGSIIGFILLIIILAAMFGK